MKFRIGYYQRTPRQALTHSPRTGKPYKRPRRLRCHFIHLRETIEARDLPEALEKALERAQQNEWTLEEVTEL